MRKQMVPSVRTDSFTNDAIISVFPPLLDIFGNRNLGMKFTIQSEIANYASVRHLWPIMILGTFIAHLFTAILENELESCTRARYCWWDSCRAASWSTKSTRSFGILASFDLLMMILILADIGFTTINVNKKGYQFIIGDLYQSSRNF